MLVTFDKIHINYTHTNIIKPYIINLPIDRPIRPERGQAQDQPIALRAFRGTGNQTPLHFLIQVVGGGRFTQKMPL